jgi:hypothetical protein
MKWNPTHWLAIFAGCITLIAMSVGSWKPSFADEYEWDPTYGYHEEEWYDPSDWFDPDDGIDYESDYYGGYYDNDMYDGDDTWYGDNYYTDDWYDDEARFDDWYGDSDHETYDENADTLDGAEEYNES